MLRVAIPDRLIDTSTYERTSCPPQYSPGVRRVLEFKSYLVPFREQREFRVEGAWFEYSVNPLGSREPGESKMRDT